MWLRVWLEMDPPSCSSCLLSKQHNTMNIYHHMPLFDSCTCLLVCNRVHYLESKFFTCFDGKNRPFLGL
ncbi:hypothetical protein EB796_012030 [Bugula neritina]|uniref:Uncharacterized protein n=1 Tax=Bugula neritina TaxID=10212 RepID=A0A7J7JTJ9_BUGNE|nr:hypothetical protein EB796_012030 [Bugula neritina]